MPQPPDNRPFGDLPHPDTLGAPPQRRGFIRRTQPLESLPDLPAPEQSAAPVTGRGLQDVAVDLKTAVGGYLSLGEKTASRPRTILHTILDYNANRPALATGALLDQAELAQMQNIEQALQIAADSSRVGDLAYELLSAHYASRDPKSLEDGNAAHWMLRAHNGLGNMTRDIHRGDPEALEKSAAFFDRLEQAGKITQGQKIQLAEEMTVPRITFAQIRTLLAEAEGMLPAYMAHVDEAILKTVSTPESGRTR